MTVISDPQGATFTASKFVAENKDLAEGADQGNRCVIREALAGGE